MGDDYLAHKGRKMHNVISLQKRNGSAYIILGKSDISKNCTIKNKKEDNVLVENRVYY